MDALGKENLTQREARSKVDYYKKAVHIAPHVGDRVLLFDELVRRGRSIELIAQWVGPYVALALVGINAISKEGVARLRFTLIG